MFTPSQKETFLRGSGLLIMLAGLVALIWLAFLPSDSESGRFLGYSPARLALVSTLLLMWIGIALASWQIFTHTTVCVRRLESLAARPWAPFAGFAAVIFAVFAALLPLILNGLYRGTGEFRYLAYSQRLAPPLLYLALLALVAALLTLLFRPGLTPDFSLSLPVLRRTLLLWGFSGLAALLVGLTRTGLDPDPMQGWGAPSVPLMEWQILLSWAAAGGLLYWLYRRAAQSSLTPSFWKRFDRSAAVLFWALAVLVWLSQPVPDGYFAFSRPPNNEIYPFSDGQFYGLYAQGILAGNGYDGTIPPRPLYVALLAVFHFVGGQSYTRVIFWQTLLLGLLPAAVYMLGARLHSRPAGALAALLTIFHELTAIRVTPFTDNISNSKLFFADLTTALVLALFLLAAVSWLQAKTPRRALLTGGLLGAAFLLRNQSAVLLPVLLLAAAAAFRGRWRNLAAHSALLTCGLLVVISPWLARNYHLTGGITFDHPESQLAVMVERYSDNLPKPMPMPGENDAAYSRRLSAMLRQSILADPVGKLNFIAAHFTNNLIGELGTLPNRFDLVSLGELWFPRSAFWQQWNGQVGTGQALWGAVMLGLLALGAAGAWRRAGLSGLIPAGINLAYNFSTAMGRFSGARYLLPVEWIVYFYAALGLVEAALLLAGLAGGRSLLLLKAVKRAEFPAALGTPPWSRSMILTAASLLLIGLLPVAAEWFPHHYPGQ